jgi:TATA-binding protein-associated factor
LRDSSNRKNSLLEKGSTSLIRNTAAEQLADVQKQHPDELFNLLGRVLPYLRSPSWDTRTAAAKAIGGIVSNAEKFDPNADEDESKIDIDESDDAVKKGDLGDGDLLQLDTIDVHNVMKYGRKLLGSRGKEYEDTLAGMDPVARLAQEKKNLTARLGLGGQYFEDDLIDQNDYQAASKQKAGGKPGLPRVDTDFEDRNHSITSASPYTAESVPESASEESGLSKRQLNQLKRKNKNAAKFSSNKMRVVDLSGRRPSEPGMTPMAASPHPVRLNGNGDHDNNVSTNGSGHADYFTLKKEEPDDDTVIVSEFRGEVAPEKPMIQPDEEQSNEWPFEVAAEFLMVDLFDPCWEIRHGAAMGLREVLRVHGKGAGRKYGKTKLENDRANRRWLDDMCCRLLSVLMLDRFGDFVSDTVVAPIRESIGQTLGALLSHVTEDTAISAYRVLRKMIFESKNSTLTPSWEVSHGGMIGLRYLVAVRKDLLLRNSELIDGVVAEVTHALAHYDDDVKSVSAATLVPIASELVTLRPHMLGELISVVWSCLSVMQDDLSASTAAVMDLLANLCTYDAVLAAMGSNAAKDPNQSFDMLVPRLYPFLRHTITTVRSAVLRALHMFLELPDTNNLKWIDTRTVRLVFQNILLERNEAVLKLSFDVWRTLWSSIMRRDGEHAISHGHFLEDLVTLTAATVQPIGQARCPIAMDSTLFIKPSGQPLAPIMQNHGRRNSTVTAVSKTKKMKGDKSAESASALTPHNTDAHMMQGEVDLVGVDIMLRTRMYAAKALGLVVGPIIDGPNNDCWLTAISGISSPNSSTRLCAAMVLEEMARNRPKEPTIDAGSHTQIQSLQSIVDGESPSWYTDILLSLQAARGQCQTLLSAFSNHAHVPRSKLPPIAVVCQGDSEAGPNAFSIQDAERITTTDFDRLLKSLTPVQRVSGVQYLNDAKAIATNAVNDAKKIKEQRDIAIRASCAGVLIALGAVPKKPGQVIKSLMDSIKTEENHELQSRSASGISMLIDHYVQSGKRGPSDKVVSNLVKFSCVDTSETPEFHPNAKLEDAILSLRKEEDKKDHPDAARFEEEAKSARIMRRGAKTALEHLVKFYGAEIFTKLPVLQSLIEEPLRLALANNLPEDILEPESETGQTIVDALSTLRALGPTFDSALHPWLSGLLPLVARGIRSRLSVIRYISAKCFATFCSVVTVDAVTMLVQDVLPNINNPVDLRDRQGIVECVYHLIHVMGDNILPYVIFLIVPVLGRMSDSNEEVRLLATTSFATLVKLVPLEAGIKDPPGMPQTMLEGRDRERKFMAQMLDPKKVEAFQIPVAIKAELRSYQQDGVNWLAFLNRFGLHGVLCDDMGLGKTLQTICIVASDHHMRAEEYAKTQAPDQRRLPSLIICPPTLSGHWQQEIRQYAPFLRTVAYVGNPTERGKHKNALEGADVVITSYDVCRNDSDVLTPISWNYCVLDEGHLIKNPKAKITQAVKKIVSNHRLILSGTPIQNNVLELWSLFDFLMPGFLGTEKIFQERFAKPIASSRNAKSSSKEQETGALAIEALHKQVLPFLLRRLKEEVLNDLPPKIIQNYYCDLSDLQRRLFEDFFRKEKKTVEGAIGSSSKEDKQHIFQALQYMRKLCNSPALVVKESHKQYSAIQKQLAAQTPPSTLRSLEHAPKLLALKDLLVDCGIGVAPDANNLSAEAVSQHRCLVFCQAREMLDMVAELLSTHLPSAAFMRLDGSIPASGRQNIVNTFNTDPSIDCLLLTTSVGGLGLNLTGADTVIFVEHDWNPQKDIQAMDRAHRIGQKKVVNVYRLIVRGTIEEKIMGLQRFKVDVASTVVNQQNAGLGTMGTGEILDLFTLDDGDSGVVGEVEVEAAKAGTEGDMIDEATGQLKKKGEKGWLDDVPELWDEKQYEESFNLDGFLQSMQK